MKGQLVAQLKVAMKRGYFLGQAFIGSTHMNSMMGILGLFLISGKRS